MFLLLNGTIYFFFMEYVRELRIKLTVSTACQRIRYSERAWTVSVHEISWIHLLSVRAAATVLICSESLVWWACKSQLRSGKVSFGRAENLTRTRSGCRRPARFQWKHWTSLGPLYCVFAEIHVQIFPWPIGLGSLEPEDEVLWAYLIFSWQDLLN